MSDKLYRIPFRKLAQWVFNEESTKGSIFGIYKENFFKPDASDNFQMRRYGQMLETPVGVAAGPHTQLSQNIIASWLCGARYIELKTVQTLDEIEVTKPCIDMEDEGYNCEWSQELKINESFDEYLNAWVIIHALRHKYGWGNSSPGFIFNMSVGYDLKGILNPKVQWFLDKMTGCREELEKKVRELAEFYPEADKIDIPDCISDNVTLSTMHGCPPGEIESICRYLIEKRKIHTTLKLNPTLLGQEFLREILNKKLGYDIIVPDEAFGHDLKYDDAKRIINDLQKSASVNNVEFGLKLTNTLESLNRTRWLPGSEKMVYTSGRALHPLSINLAWKLQEDFEGSLDISFSAGIDCFNAADTLACNIRPLTVCSDLLKPGGYLRIKQYLSEISSAVSLSGSSSLDGFIMSRGNETNLSSAGLINLRKYAGEVLENKYYNKCSFPYENIKTPRKLTEYDCIHAPCIEACAVDQNVPDYMYHTSRREYDEAYKAVLRNNPLPNMTGNVCDHLCQTKCTRMNYDNPLLIRGIKRFIAEKAGDSQKIQIMPASKTKAAIIGAGPSGLTCAYFLAAADVDVDLYESREYAGGMVAGQIPYFRLSDESITSDIGIIRSMGVRFYFGTRVDTQLFDQLRKKYDFIYIGIGAEKGKKLNIPGEESADVLDQLNFLEKVRSGNAINIGKNIAIIGGGLSAIDAARTAIRIVGENGNVTMVYRRTKKEMPAGADEINAMLEEGVSLLELTAPVAIEETDGKRLALKCIKMKLGEAASGERPKPEPVEGSEHELIFDTVITAIGQDIIPDFLPDTEIGNRKGSFETQISGVFAGGDAIRGADSLINAMGDGRKTALEIIARIGKPESFNNPAGEKITDRAAHQNKLAFRVFGKALPEIPVSGRKDFTLVHPALDEEAAVAEAERCLYCDDVCNICVTVCPNFANMSYEAETGELPVFTAKRSGEQITYSVTEKFRIEQKEQIITIAGFCNECGNCSTFCPTSGAPYKTKPHFHLTEESFNSEESGYFITGERLLYKENGAIHTLSVNGSEIRYYCKAASACFDAANFSISEITLSADGLESFSFRKAAEMYFLLKNAGKLTVLSGK